MEKDIIYKANYMQDIFNTLTEDNLNKLEKYCEKVIHYERKDGILEHQITFDLIQAYKKQQTELEKKDKTINEIAEKLAKAYHYKFKKCSLKEKEQNNIDCNKYKDCTTCIKQYFENKVNSCEQ